MSVAAATREARAVVDIVANESVSTYLLPSALAALRQRWPNTRFAVTVGTCQAVREGVASGRFDVGMLLEAAEASAAGATAAPAADAAPEGRVSLADVTLVLFSGVEHPLGLRPAAPVARARLAPYRVFSSDSSGDFHGLLRSFFHADGLPGPQLESTGSIDAVKRSVIADALALGVLPAYALVEELRAEQLRVIAVRPSLPGLRLEALLCLARPPGPAAVELVQTLRALPGSTGARGGTSA